MNFSVFRRFGACTARILFHRMLEINHLINKLAELDKADDADDKLRYRLYTAPLLASWDPAQANLLEELETKIKDYCPY